MAKEIIIEGVVKRHPDGFGFLIPDQKDIADVYLPPHEMMYIMTNDRLKVRLFYKQQRNSSNEKSTGEVVEIVQRSTKVLVGKFKWISKNQEGVIEDQYNLCGSFLKIQFKNNGKDSYSNLTDGKLVAVEILQYPDDEQEFIGKIIDVIGNAEDPITDVKRILFSHGISLDFSSQVIREAESFGSEVQEQDLQGRKDLQHLDFVTIDGVTAKDFDDAIYVEKTEQGFSVFVAIADVSHYVTPGTALDQEAYARGTSTYFPNFVVPMLPENLSNELCSLKPQCTRLVMVAEMHFNFDGELSSADFYKSVIKSRHRITYGMAQEVIDNNCPESIKDVSEMLLKAADIANILLNRRFKNGSLDLDIPESEVIVNEKGEAVDILKSSRVFSHRLIEELMLAANTAVCSFLSKNEVPTIYRIHEPPRAENIESLNHFLEIFGGQPLKNHGILQKNIMAAIKTFEGKAIAQTLNTLVLRTMNQAQYSYKNLGHFGLNFKHYTHFTSPIRRYPDLMVHRHIKNFLSKNKNTSEDLASAATQLSACEQRSVKAERQVLSIKKARFMSRFISQCFDALVISVTRYGLFVQLRLYDVEGLLRIEELGDDFFEFDPENLRLVGKRSGLVYAIGENLRVQVASVNTELGKIDFILENNENADRYSDTKAFGIKHVITGDIKKKKNNSKEDRSKGKRKGKGKNGFGKKGPSDRSDNKKRSKTQKNSKRFR